MFPRGPIDLGDRLRELPSNLGSDADGSAGRSTPSPIIPGWQILDTPGHTPGHVSFFRADDRVLLPADAFCTTNPESFFAANITQKTELHGPPAYFTWNWTLARKSVQHLAALDPLVVAPGHGQPLAGAEVPAALRDLAARFEEVAVPANQTSAA
jgi:glyoxylase-like metal-dependent hydrolase (beta-lactamase superfamily II)